MKILKMLNGQEVPLTENEYENFRTAIQEKVSWIEMSDGTLLNLLAVAIVFEVFERLENVTDLDHIGKSERGTKVC